MTINIYVLWLLTYLCYIKRVEFLLVFRLQVIDKHIHLCHHGRYSNSPWWHSCVDLSSITISPCPVTVHRITDVWFVIHMEWNALWKGSLYQLIFYFVHAYCSLDVHRKRCWPHPCQVHGLAPCCCCVS
jgi:hypothetical protein